MKSKIFDSQVSVEEQQASTSRFEDSELLNPIVYEEANRSSSPMQSNTAKSQETDPLEETTRHLIYLPASPNEHNEHHEMSHLLPSVIQRTSTAALQMSFQQSVSLKSRRSIKNKIILFIFIVSIGQFKGETDTAQRQSFRLRLYIQSPVID